MDQIVIDKKTKRTILMLVNIVGLIFLGLVFQIVDIPIPSLPSFVTLQFSVLLALLGAIAYGPFVGIFVVFAKQFFYFWMTDCSLYSLIASAVADIVFVVCASIIFYNIKGGVIKKVDKNGQQYKKIVTRRKRILIAGALSTVLAAAVGFLLVNYVELPLLISNTGLTKDIALEEYSKALSLATSLSKGVLMVNTPIMIVEYLASTVVVAFIYKPLSRFMHGRFVS